MKKEISQFSLELAVQGLNQSDMILQMEKWGDHRSFESIYRSISRMAKGQTGLSGEMQVILNMMYYIMYTNKRYEDLVWIESANRSLYTIIDDFTIQLFPQTRGRWAITLTHKDGYSHPYPRWQTSLPEAKSVAIASLQDAIRYYLNYTKDNMMNDLLDSLSQ